MTFVHTTAPKRLVLTSPLISFSPLTLNSSSFWSFVTSLQPHTHHGSRQSSPGILLQLPLPCLGSDPTSRTDDGSFTATAPAPPRLLCPTTFPWFSTGTLSTSSTWTFYDLPLVFWNNKMSTCIVKLSFLMCCFSHIPVSVKLRYRYIIEYKYR